MKFGYTHCLADGGRKDGIWGYNYRSAFIFQIVRTISWTEEMNLISSSWLTLWHACPDRPSERMKYASTQHTGTFGCGTESLRCTGRGLAAKLEDWRPKDCKCEWCNGGPKIVF